MTISVYIDSCAWNWLHEKEVNLLSELPPDVYTLCITREIEIEIKAIPDNEDTQALRDYIWTSIVRSTIQTTSIFGFQTIEPNGLPSKVQVYGGFDHGTFQSLEDQEYYASSRIQAQLVGKSERKNGLSANQADASLAVRSSQAFVLTNENTKKTGPLKLAAENGGKIIYLSEVDSSGLTLGQYMSRLLQMS